MNVQNNNVPIQRYMIYGGSFDPVHNGHTQIVRQCIDRDEKTTVIVSCAYKNPFKNDRDQTRAANRLAMMHLAFKHFDRVIIDDDDVRTQRMSYAIDMVHRLIQRFQISNTPDFIIGSDIVGDVLRWKDADVLAHLIRLVIYPRLGFSVNDRIFSKLSARGFSYQLLDSVLQMDISGTDIRRQCNECAFLDIYNAIDPAVLRYIRTYKLYGTDV